MLPIWLNLLLSVVTFGIWSFVWAGRIAKRVNSPPYVVAMIVVWGGAHILVIVAAVLALTGTGLDWQSMRPLGLGVVLGLTIWRLAEDTIVWVMSQGKVPKYAEAGLYMSVLAIFVGFGLAIALAFLQKDIDEPAATARSRL